MYLIVYTLLYFSLFVKYPYAIISILLVGPPPPPVCYNNPYDKNLSRPRGVEGGAGDAG